MYLLLAHKFYHVNGYSAVEITAHRKFQFKLAGMQRSRQRELLKVINVFWENGTYDLVTDAYLTGSPHKAALKHES